MSTVAYLTNRFPAAVEPYVMQEISELRLRGVSVLPCSARSTPNLPDDNLQSWSTETVHIFPLRFGVSLKAAYLCWRQYFLLSDLVVRIVFRGHETLGRRLRAVSHTFLGAYFAIQLKRHRIDHIHVHHAYFASWIAMVAARLLGIPYSITIHGSDLLIHKAYLDVKLEHCKFCVTVSEFNRRYVRHFYPEIKAAKLFVRRIGVDATCCISHKDPTKSLDLLAVGRLHPVKNYLFLIEACNRLKARGHLFSCSIAGEGEQRQPLQRRIRHLQLEKEVALVGHLSGSRLEAAYANADLVVLTSHSEGLPLVLMEAMARGKIVLAPAITGIPELVIHGVNGFLFKPESLDDFICKIEAIRDTPSYLIKSICLAACKRVTEHFDRDVNLSAFVSLLMQNLDLRSKPRLHENPILQQI